MKNIFVCLVIAIACIYPAILKADIYSFNAGISGFDDENVFTHTFNLGVVDEIESVSIELTHTVGLVTVVYSSVPEPSASVILFSIFGIAAIVWRKRFA